MRLALLTILTLTSLAHAEEWPGWLGPRRDGSSAEKVAPWKGELKVVWKKPVGDGHSSPVVAGGKVFLHTKAKEGNAERLDAFDSQTGAELWNKSYERVPFKSLFGNGPRATPTVVEGKVYSFGITGELACFDARDGAIAWRVDTLKQCGASNLFFGTSCSPLVHEGRVFVNVGGKGASIVAFDKDDGKEIWRAGDDKASYSSPILYDRDGRKELVFLTGAHLVALDPANGREIWKFPFRDAISESSTTPVRIGNRLFGSSITLGSVGLMLEPPGQVTKEWLQPDLTCYFATPVAVGGDLYLISGTKPPALVTRAALRCIDPATGKERWSRDNVGRYHSSLLRTGDGKLLLLEEAGNLVLVEPDPTKYRELARAKVCGNTWAHAALADSKLYVRDSREIRCIDLTSH